MKGKEIGQERMAGFICHFTSPVKQRFSSEAGYRTKTPKQIAFQSTDVV